MPDSTKGCEMSRSKTLIEPSRVYEFPAKCFCFERVDPSSRGKTGNFPKCPGVINLNDSCKDEVSSRLTMRRKIQIGQHNNSCFEIKLARNAFLEDLARHFIGGNFDRATFVPKNLRGSWWSLNRDWTVTAEPGKIET